MLSSRHGNLSSGSQDRTSHQSSDSDPRGQGTAPAARPRACVWLFIRPGNRAPWKEENGSKGCSIGCVPSSQIPSKKPGETMRTHAIGLGGPGGAPAGTRGHVQLSSGARLGFILRGPGARLPVPPEAHTSGCVHAATPASSLDPGLQRDPPHRKSRAGRAAGTGTALWRLRLAAWGRGWVPESATWLKSQLGYFQVGDLEKSLLTPCLGLPVCKWGPQCSSIPGSF